MALMIYVRYELEQIDEGWMVWRSVDGSDPEAVRVGGTRRRCFTRRADADREIENQRRADKGAATRLGVTLG